MKKKNKIKRSLFYDKDDYEELSKRAAMLGMSTSELIRKIIREYNFKPVLANVEYKTTNTTIEAQTLLRDAKNDE